MSNNEYDFRYHFNPRMTYTKSKKEIEEFVKFWGEQALRDGYFWYIHFKRIIGSQYKVWFEKHDYTKAG